MPDISMCQDTQCPSREECYRFSAKPSQMQYYSNFSELRAEQLVCENFIPMRRKKVTAFDILPMRKRRGFQNLAGLVAALSRITARTHI